MTKVYGFATDTAEGVEVFTYDTEAEYQKGLLTWLNDRYFPADPARDLDTALHRFKLLREIDKIIPFFH